MKRGFTLIELMIVLIIIGLLLTIAINPLTKMLFKSRSNEAKAVIQHIVFAEERYKQETGSFFPSSGVVKNEEEIAKELKIDLSKSNNFNYFIESLTGADSGNFLIKVVLRADDFDDCPNATSSLTICKQPGTIEEDDWVKKYDDRGEDKYYLEFKYPNKLTGDYIEGGVSYEHLYGN